MHDLARTRVFFPPFQFDHERQDRGSGSDGRGRWSVVLAGQRQGCFALEPARVEAGHGDAAPDQTQAARGQSDSGGARPALARLEAADPEARRGDVEGIHRLRTSTRRLRSELQAVRELVEKDWREHLEQELKWLATMLGNVRDLDILSHRLLAAAKPVVGLNGTSGKLPGAESNGPLKLLFQDTGEAACPELPGASRGPSRPALTGRWSQTSSRPLLIPRSRKKPGSPVARRFRP